MNERLERRPFLPATSAAPWLLFVFLLTGCGDDTPTKPLRPVTFNEGARYVVGKVPISVCLGDLDADGTLDIVVANRETRLVNVLLNSGEGTFLAPVSYDSGFYLFGSVALGDFDGDGYSDLVMASDGRVGTGAVHILVNNGDGTFRPTGVDVVHFGDGHLILQDLNGDSRLDAAISTGAYVTVLMNSGEGGFQTRAEYPTGYETRAMSSADLDRDGNMDLVIASRPTVLLNKGDGTFAMGSFYGFATNSAVATDDMNGDGYVDIAVSNTGYAPVMGPVQPGTVAVLLNKGDGTFSRPVDYVQDSVPSSIASGDFNKDGSVDLVITNYDRNDIGVLLNRGNGMLTPPSYHAVGSSPASVAAGDLNRDGRLDLVVGNFQGNDVTVLLNTTP